MNNYSSSNQSFLQLISIEGSFGRPRLNVLRNFLLLLLLMLFVNTAWADFNVGGGFSKFNTTDGNAPLAVDCATTNHDGRMVIDEVNDLVYYCTEKWLANGYWRNWC